MAMKTCLSLTLKFQLKFSTEVSIFLAFAKKGLSPFLDAERGEIARKGFGKLLLLFVKFLNVGTKRAKCSFLGKGILFASRARCGVNGATSLRINEDLRSDNLAS
jgi:hypothetical protein